MITREKLLACLPPYQDQWTLIKEKQEVKDIKRQIEIAHKNFAGYYDLIALYFDADTVDQVCNNIHDFLEKNIRYKEEPVSRQTTALPTGILYRGFGDCKHYSLFAAGVLNSIERQTGKNFNWCYRFASYNINPTPHHVFVVVKDGPDEIWIDPVPGSNSVEPTWMQDKKVNVLSMPLYENISGVVRTDKNVLQIVNGKLQRVNGNNGAAKISGGNVAVHAVKTHDLNFDNKYPGFTNVWASHGSPVLTLDPGYGAEGDAWNNWNISNLPQLVNELNAEIAKGPEPHTVDAELVNWIWKSSVRSWNFYYKQGVAPDVIQIANEKLPPEWPRAIVTPDGRLTFDKLANIWHTHNPYIHLLTGAIQKYLNDYLKDKSFIISPNQPVEYMHFQEPGKFDSINMFGQIRGNDLKKIFQGVAKVYMKFVQGELKIVLSVPRNMFMLLLSLNVFHWASHLVDQIAGGHWPEISGLWTKIGGNPDRLKQAIEKGAKEPAIDQDGNRISGPGAATIGAVQVAAIITAAVPVIALLLKYIDKSGKASEVVSAATPLLQQQFPDVDWSGLQTGGPPIDKATGQPVQWSTDPINDENLGGGNDLLTMAVQNKFPVAGIAGAGTYFLLRKKNKKYKYTIPIAVAVGTYLILDHQEKKFSQPNQATQLSALINWTNGTADSDGNKAAFIAILKQMTSDELAATYTYIFEYFNKHITLQPGTPLYNQMAAISAKYQIFT